MRYSHKRQAQSATEVHAAPRNNAKQIIQTKAPLLTVCKTACDCTGWCPDINLFCNKRDGRGQRRLLFFLLDRPLDIWPGDPAHTDPVPTLCPLAPECSQAHAIPLQGICKACQMHWCLKENRVSKGTEATVWKKAGEIGFGERRYLNGSSRRRPSDFAASAIFLSPTTERSG